MKSPWLTVQQLADYLHVSRDHIYQLVSKRKIPFVRPVGRLIFFNREEIDAWMKRARIDADHELWHVLSDSTEQEQRECQDK